VAFFCTICPKEFLAGVDSIPKSKREFNSFIRPSDISLLSVSISFNQSIALA